MAGKKHKVQQIQKKETKPNFLEIYWDKIAVVILIVLPLIYFAPFLNPNQMLAGSDYLIGGYPFEKWTTELKGLPLWYPHVFGGVPVLGAPVGGPLAPLAQLKEIIPPQVVLTLTFIIFFFIAGLGTYLYLRAIGLSKYSAAIGAVAYQFIGNLATTPEAGHAGRAASIASFPLILYFVHNALRTKRLSYFILTAFCAAFAFYEGHFQITYYGLLFIMAYVIYYLITQRKEIAGRDWARIVIYGLSTIVLICLLMAAVWLPVIGGLETAARGVERGYEYSTSWALPPLELIDLIVPSFSGILQNYWGANPFKQHLEYFGIIPLIFGLLTIFLYFKKPYVKFYIIGLVIVILICLGSATPFFRIPYLLIPGFKLFRAPALSFYLTSFSFVVLGAIGWEHIFIKKEITKKRFFTLAGALLAGITILILIATSLGRNLTGVKAAIFARNMPQFTQGLLLTYLFILAVFIVIFLSFKLQLRPLTFGLTTIILSLISQLPLMAKFLPRGPNPVVYYAADDVVSFLKKDGSVYRVFPFQYDHSQDSYLLYHNIQSAGGYIANPIQRYQDFIGAGKSVMFNPANLVQFPKMGDMLNLKYVIAPNLPEDISRYDANSQRYIQFMKSYLSRFRSVFTGDRYTVYLNDSALTRVYFVPDYQVAQEEDMLEILAAPSFNPRRMVLLEEDPKIPHPALKEIVSQAELALNEYQPNKVVCTIKCPYPGFLVLADNWHPDWLVLVDGQNRKLYRANYTFRAVYLDPGAHEVIFKYDSPYFNTGRVVSIFVLILSVCFCVLAIKFRV